MASAKDIRVAPIASDVANRFVAKHHYSGSYVRNSQLHLGVFLGDKLEGVMQFGPSLDKRKSVELVRGTGWNGFLELNRMAFSERLPKNSESRALGVAFRLIRKHYPHIEWIVSFADATQCGDGTIYRASGFVLTGIKKNTSIWTMDGKVFTDLSYRLAARAGRDILADADADKAVSFSRTSMTKGKHTASTNGASSMRGLKEQGARPLPGFQIRYVYFLNPAARQRLSVPELPFSALDEARARMYKGEKLSRGKPSSEVPDVPSGEGGAEPTSTLQPSALEGQSDARED